MGDYTRTDPNLSDFPGLIGIVIISILFIIFIGFIVVDTIEVVKLRHEKENSTLIYQK